MTDHPVVGARGAQATSLEATGVRSFWEGLGLPGLVDLRVHFLPPPIERAVWREFDTGGT